MPQTHRGLRLQSSGSRNTGHSQTAWRTAQINRLRTVAMGQKSNGFAVEARWRGILQGVSAEADPIKRGDSI